MVSITISQSVLANCVTDKKTSLGMLSPFESRKLYPPIVHSVFTHFVQVKSGKVKVPVALSVSYDYPKVVIASVITSVVAQATITVTASGRKSVVPPSR